MFSPSSVFSTRRTSIMPILPSWRTRNQSAPLASTVPLRRGPSNFPPVTCTTTRVSSGVSGISIGGAISAVISKSSSSSILSTSSIERCSRDLSFGKAQRALAYYVALDFAGAARDCVLARAQHAVEPSRGISDYDGGFADEAVIAEQFGREARDAHARFG